MSKRDKKEDKKGNGENVVEMPTFKQAKLEDAHEYIVASIQMQAFFLEQDNIKLRRDNSVLKKTIAQLQCDVEAHQYDRMQAGVVQKMEIVNPKFNAIAKKIASDAGIDDPKKMSIDTDTFIVRELGV